MLAINIKNLATCFGSLNHHQAKYKTQYWYIQRVRTLLDPIEFASYMDIKGNVYLCQPTYLIYIYIYLYIYITTCIIMLKYLRNNFILHENKIQCVLQQFTYIYTGCFKKSFTTSFPGSYSHGFFLMGIR